ncbi:linear amide C-N hydrolase [Microbulbifer agarilyticus]
MCSTILWTQKGQPVIVGRNMDWTEQMGTKLYVFPRGAEREGLTDSNSLKWTSKYGSIGAVIWDCATADGLNEAGLSVRLLYLAEAEYGTREQDLPGLSISEWVQYYLDCFATVDEVVAATRSMQVRPVEIVHRGDSVDSPMHMCVSDASGDSAIIEILHGKPVIHHGAQYRVMTNSPVYDEQLVLMKQYQGLGGKKTLPGSAEAEDRFARGAYYLTTLPEQPASYQEAVAGVLSVMRNMATPLGYVDPVQPNVSPTQWQSVSDLTNKRYYFEFARLPNVVWIDMDKLDLSEGAPVLMFDLAEDLEAAGEVSGKFKPAESVTFQQAGTVVTWKAAA